MPGGRVTPDRGFPPHIPHLRARVSRDRGRCLATPFLGQGETLSCGSLTARPWGLSLGRHTAGDRRDHRAGEPSEQSHKAVTASGDWGLDPLGQYLCCHREKDPVGRYRVLPASRLVRGPHPRGGILIFPVPASRGGMASATAPDASAAMAVDREAEGSGVLLGPEEDIDDDVLAKLLSASWPTPAVFDDQYGRFPWTPLGGSIVEQRYDAIDSRRMTSIWTTIRGMYDTLYAVPEGTATDFPSSAVGRTGAYAKCLGTWPSVRSLPRWGTSPTSPGTITRGPPLSWGRWTAESMCRVPWGSELSAPASASSRCMSSVRCATYLWYVARRCIPPHQCGGSTLKCLEAWPRGCPRWWHSRGASSWGNPLGVPII